MIKTLVLFVGAVSFAFAGTIPCATGVADVLTLTAGNGCTLGAFTSENFTIQSHDTFRSALIGIVGAEFVEDVATLEFTIKTDPAVITNPGPWVRMTYETFTNMAWLDKTSLTNINGVGVVIYETVCKSSYAANYGECPDSDVLAKLHASGGEAVTATFSQSVNRAYIQKFIAYDDASITRFSNGVGAPEPATYLGMAGGLLILGLIKRKKHNV